MGSRADFGRPLYNRPQGVASRASLAGRTLTEALDPEGRQRDPWHAAGHGVGNEFTGHGGQGEAEMLMPEGGE